MKAWQGSQPLYPDVNEGDYVDQLMQALPPEWRDLEITDEEFNPVGMQTIETIQRMLETDGPDLSVRCSPGTMDTLLTEINGARRTALAPELGSVHTINLRAGTMRLYADDTVADGVFIAVEDI